MNCQNCRAPLRLDNTLQDLDPTSFNLLADSAGQSINPSLFPDRLPYPTERKQQYDAASAAAATPVFKRSIPAAASQYGRKDDPTMSFALLTESEVMPARTSVVASANKDSETDSGQAKENVPTEPKGNDQNFPRQVEASTRLFEILSSRSDIDHPICTECTELLLASLKSRLDASNKERDAFIAFLKGLDMSAASASEVAHAQATLSSTKAAETKSFAELQTLEKEKADLEEEIAELEAESLGLDEEEEQFWRERNAFALEMSSFQDERDAFQATFDHDTKYLQQLSKTNVYSDAFKIGPDGIFATINGLRLGRLPPKYVVDWSEINAAWGYTALLLATVADKIGFAFRGFKIRPMGSTSFIEQEQKPATQESTRSTSSRSSQASKLQPQVLNLYSSGDLPSVANVFVHKKINVGMVAFLECMRQLCEHVDVLKADLLEGLRAQGGGRQAKLGGWYDWNTPYTIKNDKIGNEKDNFLSIRLDKSNDEDWTEACKWTLTTCKYLLAAMSVLSSPRE